MAESPSSVVRPDVVFIEDLLDGIDRGEILVPKFQRPFQWKPKQMTQLFDSINQGYPIGSLLLWESDRRIGTLANVGPLPMPKRTSARVRYILDGHQRMSTLYGVLKMPNAFPDKIEAIEREWHWWVWYDLRENQFVHAPSGKPAPHFLELRSVLKTMAFLRECRRLQNVLPKRAEKYIEAAELLAQRIKSYKLPIMVVQGELSQAVETFSRLNSTGRAMSTDQMVSALTYKEGDNEFHLDSRIDDIYKMLASYRFNGISRTIVFRSVVAALQMDIYRTDWGKIADELGGKLPPIVDQCENGMERAAIFLSRVCGIPSDRFLPYALQLTLLTEYFRHRTVELETHQRLLERWFWVTSYSGWFAGANDSQVNSALAEFRDLANGNAETLSVMASPGSTKPFPSQFFMRSARVRLFALFLASLKPRDLKTGECLPVKQTLRSEGTDAFVYLDVKHGSLPANRLLLGVKRRRHIIDDILSIPLKIRRLVLDSHCISGRAFRELKSGNVDGFLQHRTNSLIEAEKAFMELRGVAPAEWEQSVDPDADADDSEFPAE